MGNLSYKLCFYCSSVYLFSSPFCLCIALLPSLLPISPLFLLHPLLPLHRPPLSHPSSISASFLPPPLLSFCLCCSQPLYPYTSPSISTYTSASTSASLSLSPSFPLHPFHFSLHSSLSPFLCLCISPDRKSVV